MAPEVANATMQFMQRVDLKPAEIQAWQQCMQGLQQDAQPQEHAPADLSGPETHG